MTSTEASARDARLTAIEEKLEALLKEKGAKSGRKSSSADQAKELLAEHATCLAGLKAELSSLSGSDKKMFKSAHTKHEATLCVSADLQLTGFAHSQGEIPQRIRLEAAWREERYARCAPGRCWRLEEARRDNER